MAGGGAAKTSRRRLVLVALVAWAAGLALAAAAAADGLEVEQLEGAGAGLGAGRRPRGRGLEAVAAEEAEPTLDEVDSAVFSRAPYSRQVTSLLVYYAVCGIYVMCAVVLLVGMNLDSAERRKRLQRAIVPQEFVDRRFLCIRYSAAQESVPCEITEQYYMDRRLLAMRTPEEVANRKLRMGLWGYFFRNGSNFAETLTREHLLFSFVPKAIPTFTRVKRAALLVTQIHICMLIGAVLLNVREHRYPTGKYALFVCGEGEGDTECLAVVPVAVLAAAIACPVFRFTVFRHVRLTCFVSQAHPSSSRFPLGVRKFASLAPRSILETLLCMRNEYERQKARVAQSRRTAHRAVHAMWQTTRSSIKDLRFYNPLASALLCGAVGAVVVASLVYVLSFTVYLQDDVAYYWLVWVCAMQVSWLLLIEPALLLWTQVLWTSAVETLAQRWGYGSHALAATSKHEALLRDVDEVMVAGLRRVASTRVQRWWRGTLSAMKGAAAAEAEASVPSPGGKKIIEKRNFLKDKKWCLRVEVLDCGGLQDAPGGVEVAGLFARLRCDAGNPNVSTTKVVEEARTAASFNERFFLDIKDSSALNVELCRKTASGDEVVGQGQVPFSQWRAKEEQGDFPEGHLVKVQLKKGGPGPKGPVVSTRNGAGAVLNLRVAFLDPLKDHCGVDGDEDWMLPKNRMKFALNKMGPGGKGKVGKMLGGLPPSRTTDFSSPGAKNPADKRGSAPAVTSLGAAAAGEGEGPAAAQRAEQAEQAEQAEASAAAATAASPGQASAGEAAEPPEDILVEAERLTASLAGEAPTPTAAAEGGAAPSPAPGAASQASQGSRLASPAVSDRPQKRLVQGPVVRAHGVVKAGFVISKKAKPSEQPAPQQVMSLTAASAAVPAAGDGHQSFPGFVPEDPDEL